MKTKLKLIALVAMYVLAAIVIYMDVFIWRP